MAEELLKGLNKVDKIINNFTAQFNITARFDAEFQAFCDERVIGYSLIALSDGGGQFIEDAIKRYPQINADIFLWAIMHEIGHCMTEDMWTEEEKNYFWEQKEMMENAEDIDWDNLNAWYHVCPDEFFATRWAGEYMVAHQGQIRRFWRRLQKALLEMYRVNGLI